MQTSHGNDTSVSTPTAGAAHFTWIPSFAEMAEKLVAFRHRQQEQIDLLEGLRAKGLTITPLGDKDAAGNPFLMKELDPFTFFGVFNRGITSDKRTVIVEELVKFFGVVRLVRHLRRTFQATVGVGPKTYARFARFQRAVALGRSRPGRWSEIARAVGYFDQAHLTADFRELARLAPGALRSDIPRHRC